MNKVDVAIKRVLQAVKAADRVLLKANETQMLAERQKMDALYQLLDSVADARTELRELKATHGKALVKAGLQPLKAGKTKTAGSKYVKLFLASGTELNGKLASKYAGIIEHAMKQGKGKKVSDFIRELGGIKQADLASRSKNKRGRR